MTRGDATAHETPAARTARNVSAAITPASATRSTPMAGMPPTLKRP